MERSTSSVPATLRAAVREGLNVCFQVSLVLYLGLFLWEKASPGIVSRYLDLDFFFYVAVVLGLLTLTRPFTKVSDQPPDLPRRRDSLLLFGITTLTIWFANTQIPSLGFWAWLGIFLVGFATLSGIWVGLSPIGDKDDDPDRQ